MIDFQFHQARDIAGALKSGSQSGAKFIGGGTNLIDLMKEGVERPSSLIDINPLDLRKISSLKNGGLQIGALVSNSAVAEHPEILTRYPLVAKAILAGASPQLRNMATTGGNLLQRTRCYYFYDQASACNKRNPGSGCDARNGLNRIHAILGTSDECIAVHPSDFCVALAALGAAVNVEGKSQARTIPFSDFHRLPGAEPQIDTSLQEGELITSVDLPEESFTKVAYVKVRDRWSYAFALVSVAAALKFEKGKIAEARFALGGVAHKPWRVPEAEKLLAGEMPKAEAFRKAAERALTGAKGFGKNDFKIELAKRAIVRALTEAAAEGGE